MRAILIDPAREIVTNIKIGEHYTEISKALNCRLFDIVQLTDHEDLFIDDEGLFLSSNPIWRFNNRGGFYAGRGLILGNNIGETISTRLSVDFVRSYVEFPRITAAQVEIPPITITAI